MRLGPRFVAVCCAIGLGVSPSMAGSREQAAPFATVVGSVWDARDRGVPEALVRLRNVTTGRAAGTARTDGTGQFRFERVAPGTFAAEVLDGLGSVVAIGQTFSVAAGETAATFVRLGGRPRWFAGFFGNAAAAAIATAAGIGVTAIAPTGQPVSGVR